MAVEGPDTGIVGLELDDGVGGRVEVLGSLDCKCVTTEGIVDVGYGTVPCTETFG